LVAFTVRVEVPPEEIDVGFADMLAVGAGGVLDFTVKLMVVYEAPPQWSHSSTTVCSYPVARLSRWSSFVAFTT
jgi:hypothetical protein